MPTGTAAVLYPKTTQSARLLRRDPRYSGLRLLLATASPFHPNPPPLASSKRKLRSSTIHASASSFPSSPTPLRPTPAEAEPPSTVAHAGRSKKNKKPSSGRIEGSGDVRREAKSRARVRSRRLAENAFYRRKRLAASGNQADAFTDAELEMIGLGYDRSVRFMDGPDDPRLRHPHDWYRFGRYGPYSWRGIVVGPPIRGRFSDDRVSLMAEVADHDEWDRIEQFEMSVQFSNRLNELGDAVGFRYFWVFVRHPKWRPDELPWQQWTLSAEVAVQASKDQRLDKWSLMGRFGNPTRELITRCAAWTRPDIIYVKRPLYQSRFEPQEDFFNQLRPLVDPATENQFLFDLEHDGQVIRTTYFGGLCRIVKARQKAYVDDVVNAYSRLSDAEKSLCLDFLLTNHPTKLLHPYTKEWKVKLEEMELGCDAPDGSDDEGGSEITDWAEDDGFDEGDVEDSDSNYKDEVVNYKDEEIVDAREEVQADEVVENNESEKYWDEQWKMAMRSSDKMEKLIKTSINASDEYNKQLMQYEKEMEQKMANSNTVVMEQEQTEEDELEQEENAKGRSARDGGKSEEPPGLFLRAAVRPFTYRNLVKEIVLMRHRIIDGEII